MELKTKDELLEDMQEAIVKAGGRFFRKSELEGMTIGEAMDNFTQNGLEVSLINVKDLLQAFDQLTASAKPVPRPPYGDPDVIIGTANSTSNGDIFG